MFVIIAIILGILIGFIRGGSFDGFRVRKILMLPLGIIGVLLQFVLHVYYYTGGIETIDAFLPVVNFISYILILVMLVFNLDDLWTIMMSVGLTANFIVTFINGGKMPVATKIMDSLPQAAFATSINEGTNAVYAVMQQSGLWVLGVNVPIPFMGGLMQYFGSIGGFSIGSAVVFMGVLGWVQYAMKRKKAAFSKEESIGEMDYILPPQEEDDDDFFSDYEDEDRGDLYPEESFDEDPIGALEDSFDGINEGLTDVIPKLTPETLAAIQDGDSKAAIGQSILDEYDSKQSTKVFTAIKDISACEPEEASEEANDVEDTGPVSGFFTQSFYAEKEKGKLAFEKENPITLEEPEEKIPEERVIIEAPVAIIQKPQAPVAAVKPSVIESIEKTPFYVENDKVISNPEYETTMKSEEKGKGKHSESDMLNIWQQVNQHQERVRARKRPNHSYGEVKEPFKAEREKKAAAKAVVYAQEVAKTQAVTEAQPVYRQVTPEPVSVAPVVEPAPTNKTVITPPIAPTVTAPLQSKEIAAEASQAPIKKSATISDEEREKAGYERVKLEVEGREVVFWRKKKDL